MQRTSHRQRHHVPPDKAEKTAQIAHASWAIASAHKVYTALLLSLLLSSALSAAHPKAAVRTLATSFSFGIWGALVSTVISNARIQTLKLDKQKMLAEADLVKAGQERREAEIADRQRSLDTAQAELEAAQLRHKALEESYKAKADAAATNAAQREASRRIAEAERMAKRQVEEAEKRLSRAIKEADASVKRMKEERSQGIQAAQTEAEAKVLAIQTDADRAIAMATEKVTAAEVAAQKAKEDSRITIKEFSEQVELSRQEAEKSKQASIDKVMVIKTKAQQQEAGAHRYKETVHQVLGDERAKVNDRVQTLSGELARVSAELVAQKDLVTRLTGPKFFQPVELGRPNR